MKKIIAINGDAGSGKDTIANMLCDMYTLSGKKCELFKFATPLYESIDLLYKFYGFDNIKDRSLMQFLGDWVRNKNIDYFANSVKKSIEESDCDIAIITDLRFKNEMKIIESENTIYIQVLSNRGSILTDDQKNHISENDLKSYNKWNHIIINDGCMADLLYTVKNIFSLTDSRFSLTDSRFSLTDSRLLVPFSVASSLPQKNAPSSEGEFTTFKKV